MNNNTDQQYVNLPSAEHAQPQLSESEVRQLAYWTAQLSGALPVLKLPTDRPRSPKLSGHMATHILLIPHPLIDNLRTLSQQHSATLFMTLLTAFKVLLHRYTGQTDIIVGTVGAEQSNSTSSTGGSSNLLALRTSLVENPIFQDLLSHVRGTTLGAFDHQSLPFEQMVDAIQPACHQNAIFQTFFQLKTLSNTSNNNQDLTIEKSLFGGGEAALELALEVVEGSQGLSCYFHYYTDLFDPSTIRRMAGHFERLLQGVVETPGQVISKLPLLTEVEQHQLLVEWNNTQTPYSKDKCIHHLFEEQVERTPDAIATVFETQQLTYRELNAKANQLAHYLQTVGVGPDVLVGICVKPSIEMMVGILAILKAGGAYVPLDPDYPSERLAYILSDTSVPVVLTQQALQTTLPPHDALVIHLDAYQLHPSTYSEQNVSATVTPANLAYAIYTSGSTGRPKGVLIQHQGLCNLAQANQKIFQLTENKRCLQSFSLSFDGSVWSIFPTLISGATLYLVRKEQLIAGEQLADWLHHNKINVMTMPPALLSVLPSHPLPHLESIATGGEACSPTLVAQWSPNRHFFNAYGPTEATVCATIAQVTDTSTQPPIGYPIANTQTYILDPHLQPVPIGVPGELLIGGDGLARGYLNRPDLTAERFIPHPFSDHPQARLYKTGDLVRYLPDGQIEYLGRIDHQVKIRGFRIELGEIEAILLKHSDIKQAVVVVRETSVGDKQLVAYVTAAEQHTVSRGELQRYLKSVLPAYMVPSIFVILEALPLTPNGKIDRLNLPAPDLADLAVATAYTAPRSEIEATLVDIWVDVMQRNPIGIHDNFFDLGGHSILATRIATQVQQVFQVDLPLSYLFGAPTIASLAAEIVKLQADGSTQQSLPSLIVAPSERHQPFPLTDVQQAYWIGRTGQFELGNVATHAYYEIECVDLDLDRLNQTLNQLIKRHEMLRMIISADGQQQILPQVAEYQIPINDVRGQRVTVVDETINSVRNELSHQVIPTDQWPLFDIRATHLDEHCWRLHLSLDILVFDGWSLHLFFDEWQTLYEQPTIQLEALELSFRDYVLTENTLRDTELHHKAWNYWQQRLPSFPNAPELPLAVNPSAIKQPRFNQRKYTLDQKAWTQLKRLATQNGLTPSSLLAAAYAEVIALWSKSSHFAINLTLFNRLPFHAQVNDVIGDFTSLTLLEVKQTDQTNFYQRAQQLQQQLLEDLDHRYVSGVSVLRKLSKQSGQNISMPVVFTSLLLQRESDGNFYDWLGEVVDSSIQTPQTWLDCIVSEAHGELTLIWNVIEELFPAGLLDQMFAAFCHLLHQLADKEESWQIEWPQLAHQLVSTFSLTWSKDIEHPAQPKPAGMLHTLFAEQVERQPHHQALVAAEQTLTYESLYRYANYIGHELRAMGATPNTLVAIVMDKGWEQVVAALGILHAGAAYLPIAADFPQERMEQLLDRGEVSIVLTQPWVEDRFTWPQSIQCLAVETELPANANVSPLDSVQTEGDLAYMIYTSGSTGMPKGVMIDHRGAVNTVLDVNQRFDVGPQDRVFALSSLSFDLSVYDIFGTLAAGGTIVMPPADATRDPAQWVTLLNRENVSIWNSVPALMSLLVEYIDDQVELMPASLRLVMMSGDWIPLTLPDKIRALQPSIQIISMGGATEASIWSILYPIETVDLAWPSIPYGKAMVNQTFSVLNDALEPCPVWVPGQLYIGGIGLAKGYWQDEEKSNASFFHHPRTGERLYRTGDLGRYLPDGNIEFLGREDFQVKIQGFRVELGEVEAILIQHPAVRACVAAVQGEAQREKRLVAYVVYGQDLASADQELRHFLADRLPKYMVPSIFVPLERLPLTSNGKVNRKALPAPSVVSISPAKEQTATRFELQITDLVKQVLGVDSLDADTDFLTLGATSIDMIRIVNRIEKELSYRPAIDELYRTPTVAGLSRLYAKQVGESVSSQIGIANLKGVHPVLSRLLDVPALDPADRDAFKQQQPGLRSDLEDAVAIALPAVNLDEGLYWQRRSHRQFSLKPVDQTQLSELLQCLRSCQLNEKHKYRYGSAGGLYPVQTYLYVQPGRISGLTHGTYYYHPIEHRLYPLRLNAELDPSTYDRLINRPIFHEAAFSLFLVGQLAAMTPIYREASLHYATIEAGLITQLLEMSAPICNLGLCQVGEINSSSIRQLFKLDDNHVLLHSLLGGAVDTTTVEGVVAQNEVRDGSFDQVADQEAARLLQRIDQLSDEDVARLLEEN